MRLASTANAAAAGEPGARRKLRCHRGHRGEHQTGAGQRGAERQRPLRGNAGAQQTGRTERTGEQRRPERQQQGGGQAGVAADRGRVDQFGATGFLVGAGVADDGEDDRHADQQMEHAGFPDAGRTEAVVVDVSVERPLRRAGHDGRGERRRGPPGRGRPFRCRRCRRLPAVSTAVTPRAATRSGRGAGRAGASRAFR